MGEHGLTDEPLRVMILELDEVAPPGWLGDALDRAGATVRTVRLYAGDPLPARDPGAALVILGGAMGAYEEDAHPVLVEIKRLVRAAQASSAPVLGVCLGAQVIADALGGRAFPASVPEFGHTPVALTPEGRQDPVLAQLDGEVLNWHQDSFNLPPGATLLARSDRYPQAFRIGRTLGLQFHPEAPPEILERWIAGTPPEKIAAAGADPAAVLTDAHRRRDRSASTAIRLFTAWLDDVRSDRAATGRDD